LRDTTSSTPVPASLITDLRQVSREDVRNHPAWAFAPIAVQSNYERHQLNQSQAEAFARCHGLPLVKWKRDLKGRASQAIDEDTLEELFDNEPGMWQWFVRGAPAALTSNIQPTKFLTNGAAGFMHSLSLYPAQHELEAILQEEGFKVIVLDTRPAAINFQLSLPDGDNGGGIESLVDDAIVVPVVHSPSVVEYATTSLMACMKGCPQTLKCQGFPIDLAFAITDFKLQGKTKDELILSVAPRSFPPHVDLKGFYVDVSRVRRRDRLRVLHLPSRRRGGLDSLLELQHTRELAVWNAAYDALGDWSHSLGVAAANKIEAAPKRKRKLYKPLAGHAAIASAEREK
jgi:hypothetical protein